MNALTLTLKYGTRHFLQFGPLTRRKATGLLSRERWSREQREPLIDKYLRQSLLAAARSIPGYSQLRGHVPERGLAEFIEQALPIVTKSDLKRHPERYYPNGNRPKLWWSIGRTSGTSGSPLSVYRDVGSIVWEHAVLCQHWAWAGFRPGQKQVVLRGDYVVPHKCGHPPFWFHDRIGKSLFISTRHLNGKNAPAIAQAIVNFKARTLRAYPSAAYELASLSRDLDLGLRFHSIITGSEPLFPIERELIESEFRGKAFVGYGMAERVANAAQCEFGRMHLNPEYGHVEIVDAKGKPTHEEGFIVGTSFHNHAMPLIRYQLEDMARWNREPCPCGRSYPVLQDLNGRIADQLFDLNGLPVNQSVLTFPFKGIDRIQRAQIAQIQRDHWVIRIVPEAGYSETDASALISNFRLLVSSNLNIGIEIVDTIPRLPNGKFKWISQEWQSHGIAH